MYVYCTFDYIPRVLDVSRFIPDEETFDDRKPVSTANHSTHLVGAYTPNRFINTALQQTTVRLTWDETDAKRLSSTMKKYTKEEALSADLRDYLASSSSESDSEFKHSEFGNGNQNCEMDEDKLEIYKVSMPSGLILVYSSIF